VNKKLLNIVIMAAIEAGKDIMDIYKTGDFNVNMKSDNSPLTKADILSHNKIVKYLKQTNIPVLSEEGKDIPFVQRKNWKKLWIVDPLDGTKEFIKRNGEFTVNIALVENNIPVLGVVYAPALKELYFASKEMGAFKVNTNSQVTEVEDLIGSALKLPFPANHIKYTIVASRSHVSKETEDFIKQLETKYGNVELISKGSSLKLCMIAEGVADCYPRFAPTMEWDTAAGQAICMYAGRDVVDWNTKKTMIYNRENLVNSWFLAN
jgi:3'(2'), 5'-bisphosphate nucleotidase